MRKLFKRAFCVFSFAVFLVLVCSTVEDPTVSARRARPSFTPVRLWLENHPMLDGADAVAGCAYWCDRGVICVVVQNAGLADVRVHIDPAPCTPSADRTFHLADATLDAKGGPGTINFRAECFRNSFPRSLGEPYDRAKFRSVFAHEMGHEFGIWDHVPDVCTEKHKRHRNSGAPVCGDALMNALWEASTPVPTPVDDLAFDERDMKLTVLHPSIAWIGDEDDLKCRNESPKR